MAKKKKTAKKVAVSETVVEKEEVFSELAHIDPMSDVNAQAGMTFRQRMAVQNAKAKKKFAETTKNIYKIPENLRGSIPKDSEDLVELTMPLAIKVNHKVYGPGKVVIPKHLERTIKPMIYKKQQADLSIFVGKNYRVQKIGGKTVRTDLGSAGLDLKALVGA